MNAKGILLPILAVAIYMLAACNWTVGDCYPREEWVKGEGAGGPVGPPVPVYTSVASGDFGAEPPEGGERKIQCNKTEDEDEEETPSDSSDRPTASPTNPPDPCQQSGAPSMGCTGTKPIDPRVFNFVTTLAYDGTSVAGGWQEATAKLFFGHNLEGDAACVVIVGMPIRAKAWGMISAETAAIYSTDVANRCADYLYEDGGRDLPPGIFCERHKGCMRERFPKYYEELGARVK
ncbi:hypothetical protein WMF37_07160 [Sorangium sp. So ce291]|uniref:hypothetical protein n=1 Tax=Sorangium sp. So ce291 TaxID=3133294 RepID=UPI003F60B7DC